LDIDDLVNFINEGGKKEEAGEVARNSIDSAQKDLCQALESGNTMAAGQETATSTLQAPEEVQEVTLQDAEAKPSKSKKSKKKKRSQSKSLKETRPQETTSQLQQEL